jgi:hypothetical protein
MINSELENGKVIMNGKSENSRKPPWFILSFYRNICQGSLMNTAIDLSEGSPYSVQKCR